MSLLAGLVVVGLGVSVGGCKRGGGRHGEDGYALAPVSRNHDLLVGTFTWANPEKSLADAAAVAAKLGLPFGAADLKSTLLAQAPYRAAWEQIDVAKPVAAVLLALPQPQGDGGVSPTSKSFGFVTAFTPRTGSPPTAGGWAPSFGVVVEKRQEAVAVAPASPVGADGGATVPPGGPAGTAAGAVSGETLYLLVREGALLVADSWASLTQGGALALTARQGGASGPTLSIRPAGIAKMQGTTVVAALEQGRALMHEATGLDAKTPAAVRPLIDDLTGLALGWLADTESFDLGLALDDKDGLRLSLAVRPTTGTPFAKLIASGEPYRVEPALLGLAPPAIFAATGATGWLKAVAGVVRKSLEGLPSSPESRFSKEELLKTFDVLTDTWTGAGTLAVREEDDLSYDFVYRIDESKAGMIVERLERALGPWSLGDLAGLDPSLAGSTFVLEKEDDAFYGHFVTGKAKASQKRRDKAKVVSARRSPRASDVLPSLSFRIAVDGSRLIAAVGVANKEHFQSLRHAVKSNASPPPNAALAEALTTTSGALGVEYVDIAALVRVALRAAARVEPRGHAGELGVAGLANAFGDTSLALFAEIRGGESLLTRLQIPMETAASAARLTMQFLGGAFAGSAAQRPR